MLPRRLEREVKPGQVKRVRSPGHLKWVRDHACCVPGCDGRPIEAAHVRTGTDGGIGLKTGDHWTISLCQKHHAQQHTWGEQSFESMHAIDMKALAREFAAKSPFRGRWR